MDIVFVDSCPEDVQIISKDEMGLIDLSENSARQSISSMKLDRYGNILDQQGIVSNLIDDKLYNKIDGQWTMSVVSNPARSFDERNKLKGLVNLISSSNIEMIGTEIVDGQNCYKVKVRPEMNAVRSILSAQASSIQSAQSLSGSSDLSYTVWLTVDKCIPKKMDADIAFTLISDSIDIGLERMPSSRIDVKVKDILVLSDFDSRDNTEVPYLSSS